MNKWLKEGGKKSTFQCSLCITEDLDCLNQGSGTLLQHMKTKGHLGNIKILKNNSTFFFESSQTPSSTDNIFPTPQLRLGSVKRSITLNFQKQVTKAEAIWALTVTQCGYSFKSCDEIGDVFRHMFPDSKIAQEFNMQSKKISYVLSHVLGPYFHHELIKCLKRNEKFVLCFDGQTNNQNRKQSDLLVKYWLIEGGNTKNKTISEQLSKVTEELIKILKKTKR